MTLGVQDKNPSGRQRERCIENIQSDINYRGLVVTVTGDHNKWRRMMKPIMKIVVQPLQ